MDRGSALARLPGDYALALLLRDAGATDELVADRLAIDVQQLPVMLRLAEEKLAALLEQPGSRRKRA